MLICVILKDFLFFSQGEEIEAKRSKVSTAQVCLKQEDSYKLYAQQSY